MLGQIILLIACAVVTVAVLHRLRLPPVIAYLMVGIAVGPHALGWVPESHAVQLLAEVGVAFLLFEIGLEFSLPQFFEMRYLLLGLGGAQVLVGTASGAVIALALGMPLAPAVVVGGALAMSSTAIVIKQLTTQAELQARHGRLALGILLFQDLAAVPFLVGIPILAANDASLSMSMALGMAGLKALAAFAVMLGLGRYGLRPLFYEAAATRSSELFTLTVLLVSLCAAWLTAALGLSLALGAFLAGMTLSETEYRHQIEAELRPFKDVLLGLFFVTIGMRLDLGALPAIGHWVLLLTLGLVAGKGGLIAALAWGWRREMRTALRTGLVLAQGGEFGFALIALALSTGLMNSSEAQPILAAMVISMLIAPLIIRHNWRLVDIVAAPPTPLANAAANEIAAAAQDVHDHVIIAGYGRVGMQVASLLRLEKLPFVAVDLHPARSREGWEDGLKVFYGDATSRDVLEALGLDRARALVVSFADERAGLRTVQLARHLRGDIPILVRSADDSRIEALLLAGADEVVPETLETSLMLNAYLMSRLGASDTAVEARLREVRRDRYLLLRDLHPVDD